MRSVRISLTADTEKTLLPKRRRIPPSPSFLTPQINRCYEDIKGEDHDEKNDAGFRSFRRPGGIGRRRGRSASKPQACPPRSLQKEIKANTLNKFKSFLVDTPAAFLYESTLMGKSEFHFVANVKASGTTFGAEDTKGPIYTKADAELMLKCFQTLTAKK